MSQKWIYVPGLIIIALIVVFFYKKYNVAPTIDFSRLSLTDLEEKPVRFDAFKGKKAIVCFSASWCPSCLNELKEINAVKNGELSDVEIIVISDEPIEKILSFKDMTGYPFTFLKLIQSFNQVGINSIPTSYLVNSRQEVKKETVGYINWADASTSEHLKKLMN